MEQIEVNIKLQSNNKIYNIPIRKLDKVLKLKEYCQILSKIPPNQQNLLYKGKILSDEKLINDYNIENNHNIILVKKEKLKIINAPIESFINNKEINCNEIANAARQIPDVTSHLNNMDMNKVDNYFKSMGFGSFSDIFGCEPHKFKEFLKDPQIRDMTNNVLKDPSLLEYYFNNTELKNKIKNNHFMRFCFQNPQITLTPQNLIREQNIFKEDEININESSVISAPQEPFRSQNKIIFK